MNEQILPLKFSFQVSDIRSIKKMFPCPVHLKIPPRVLHYFSLYKPFPLVFSCIFLIWNLFLLSLVYTWRIWGLGKWLVWHHRADNQCLLILSSLLFKIEMTHFPDLEILCSTEFSKTFLFFKLEKDTHGLGKVAESCDLIKSHSVADTEKVYK